MFIRRYEWQSRTSIHAHGAARFKNDPGLVDLTYKTYLGHLASKKLESGAVTAEHPDYSKCCQEKKLGEESEIIVTKYTDRIITAMNTGLNISNPNVPDPHPCSYNNNLIIDVNSDYKEIINCCQRHVCRLDGYCKSSRIIGKCRFGYPFNNLEKTKIQFTETENNVSAEIVLKRNDPYLNMHNRFICQNWRGNTDMQMILDRNAAIRYMVKYATKGNNLINLYE